jgi:acetamidase/formamidase
LKLKYLNFKRCAVVDHYLGSSSETCHWGYFDAGYAPKLRVSSGDRVTIDTVNAMPDTLPDPSRFHIPPEIAEIHHNVAAGPGHILTGPVFVEGAHPGSVLEVRILDVVPNTDWGFNLILPAAGTLPHDFDEKRTVIIPLDVERGVATLSWGLELPLKPFFGVMGVAPPPGWGRLSTLPPNKFGGNFDNKELVAGSTLFLPVFAEGALFSCGDGHGCQGDGEVNVTAIETGLRGTFEFIVRDDLKLDWPRAETATHHITMGIDPSLDQAAIMALRDMIRLLGEEAGLSREDAYMLCSLAGDLHITQTVNGNKGVHMMMEKSLLTRKAA